MLPEEFVKKYYNDALISEKRTKVPAVFTLAQGALETGWGQHIAGNNFFGIKDTDGINGNEQLITTTEYSTKGTLIFPQIISKVFDPIKKLYKYVVKTYFRKYNTAEESFEDHAKFFLKNSRYHDSFKYVQSPDEFAKSIAKAGYATDPNYADKLISLIHTIQVIVNKNNLNNETFISN